MRYELSYEEWIAIKPMLPNKPRGVPRVNDRRVLNGIFWILRSRAPWRDLPNNFGPYTTCYNRAMLRLQWRRQHHARWAIQWRSAASLGHALTLAVSLEAVGRILFGSRHLSRLRCRPHEAPRTIHGDRRRDRAKQKQKSHHEKH
jgi:transposase